MTHLTVDGPSRPSIHLWWLPVAISLPAVAVLVWVLDATELGYSIGGAVAVALLALVWRRPAAALVALAIFLPIEPLLFGFLLGLHVPASLLRGASAFKELMVLALVVAAAVNLRRTRPRLAAVDKLVIAYIGVVTVYLAVPHLFSPVAPTLWHARLLAWRSDCVYGLVFLAARHAPVSRIGKERFYNTVRVMGAVTVAGALYQKARPASWLHFLLGTDHQIQYLQLVVHQSTNAIENVLRYPAVLHPVHVGSIFLSPYDMSDYLVLVAALSLDRIMRNRKPVPDLILLAGVVAALFFSSVRADALALLIVVLVLLLPNRPATREGRARLVWLVLLGAVVIVPALAGSRFVGAQGGSASSSAHLQEISRGISIFEKHPLGYGLGAQPGTAIYLPGSNGNPTDITTDNAITQTADELGIEGLVPWALFLIAALLALWKRSAALDEPYAGAAFLALLGILIAGQNHHVFIQAPVPWTLWAVAGLALAAEEAPTALEETLGTGSGRADPEPVGVW